MKTARILALAGATAALALVAIPASAANVALPADEQLVAASCDGTNYETATLFTVDAATGSSTAQTTAPEGYGCAYQGAWDPITQSYYYTIWDSEQSLLRFDPATGVTTVIGEILDETDTPVFADSLVIGLDGVGYINENNELYEIDLTTAVVTSLGVLADQDSRVYGSSVDPVTGDLYFLEESGDLLLVDPAAVTATLVDSWGFSAVGDFTWGLAIDSAGTAWVVESPGEETYTALYSSPLASFGDAPIYSGELVNGATGETFTGWWVSVIPAAAPAPALAATGVDATPALAAGLMLALGGLVLVASRRRTA